MICGRVVVGWWGGGGGGGGGVASREKLQKITWWECEGKKVHVVTMFV